jgi:hypothetical protein
MLIRRFFAAAVLLAPPAALADPDFFSVRDQNPLIRSAYLPLPMTAGTAGEGLAFSAGVEWSNTVNIESNAREALTVDEETIELDLTLARFVGPWRFRATLPVMNRSAGVLDGAIDDWHRFFGLPQGARPDRARYGYAVSYTNSSGVALAAPRGTALGDLALEAGRVLLEHDGASLALYAGLEAPTGERRQLTGNGSLDAALWLEAGTDLGSRFALAGRAGVSRPGGDGTVPFNASVGFGTVALKWRATTRLEAALQLDAHSAVAAGSSLKFLDQAVMLTFGGRYRLDSGTVLEAGVVEDIDVDHSPDVTFHFGWRVPLGRRVR